MSRPLRDVVHAQMMSGQGGVLGNQGRRVRWYDLTLSCGHIVERIVRYKPGAEPSTGGRGGGSLPESAALPPPKRARCDYCDAP